jgi:MOSC domain-containing protein YiiM
MQNKARKVREQKTAVPVITGTLVSIQVGKIQRLIMPENVRVDFRHPFWTSAIFKTPISGTVQVSKDELSGDQVADREHHGGPDNVVLAYDADHYPVWQRELNMPELPHGSFGENFTVRGFSDATVCIGDTWQVGDALLLQVTQARQPCYKLARRLQQPHIVKRIHENSWGGWYLRVLKEGPATAGMPIRLIERKHPEWTVEAAVQTLYRARKEPEKAAALAALPELSARWKANLADPD